MDAVKRYAASERGREVLERYNRSKRRRAARRLDTQRYRTTERGRLVNRAEWRRKRERAVGVICELPPEYEVIVFEVFGQHCIACSAQDDLVLDHHRPLQDGHALLHNAVPLCRSCNARKNRNQPEDFYDPWKLTEIEVLLWETRAEFDRRFGDGYAA